MANAVALTTTMASAAKNSFASALAQGGAGPDDYVPHLTDFGARANGVKLPVKEPGLCSLDGRANCDRIASLGPR